MLSRSAKRIQGARSVVWDGKTSGEWARELEGAAAVLNVAGESVFTHWSDEEKKTFISSRVDPTKALCQAIQACKDPPAAWVNANAVGYYGDTGDLEADESSPPGSDFLANLCKEWEAAQEECVCPATKKSRVRIGFVLGNEGGALPLLKRLTALFLGSATGNGRQWVPWIHVDDLAVVFRLCVDQRLEGPINGVGPSPVTNSELMTALRKVMHRPWAPNVPKPLLRLGSLVALPPPEVTLASQRVVSKRLKGAGFSYKFPRLELALKDLID